MPLPLTRRLALSAITILAGSTLHPITGAAEKKLPPCESQRGFGAWLVKIWDTLGGIQGAIFVPDSGTDAMSAERCGVTKDFPGFVVSASNGAPVASVGFACPNALLSARYAVTLRMADGAEKTDTFEGRAVPIPDTATTGIWLDASALLGPSLATLRRGGQITLQVKGGAGNELSYTFDAANFAAAWQFLGTETTRLKAARDKQCGGCLITTACCEHLGLHDDCFELRALRAFRDGPLQRMPGGRADIIRYYSEAPFILRAISADDPRILTDIYFRFIVPSAVAAHLGLNMLARTLYTRMMHRLEVRCAAVTKQS